MKPKIVIVGISGESVFLKTDHFHRFGETITVSEKYTEPGGKGYNQAVASAIFGADVTFLTIVGNDYYGEYAIDYLKDKGVNVKYRIVSDKQTSYATILTDKNGNNQVSVFAGSANSLTKEDVLLIENEIKNADYVLLQLEVSNEIISKVLEITKKYEVKVALNPAPSNLPSNHPFYHMVDILTPNEIEVRDIFAPFPKHRHQLCEVVRILYVHPFHRLRQGLCHRRPSEPGHFFGCSLLFPLSQPIRSNQRNPDMPLL